MELLKKLFDRYPQLVVCSGEIENTLVCLVDCYQQGGKLLLCGNGGSAADCGHISGELLKGFLSKRPLSEMEKTYMKENAPDISDHTLNTLQGGLPALPLPELSVALSTAFANDCDPNLIYAQLVLGLGKKGDVLFCISTSGNAENCCQAALTAKARGMKTVGLTGAKGGRLKEICDITICVPETETYKVQELHLPVYHTLCAGVEKALF